MGAALPGAARLLCQRDGLIELIQVPGPRDGASLLIDVEEPFWEEEDIQISFVGCPADGVQVAAY